MFVFAPLYERGLVKLGLIACILVHLYLLNDAKLTQAAHRTLISSVISDIKFK